MNESVAKQLDALGYDRLLFEQGLLSEEELRAQYHALRYSDDNSPEHYRYRQALKLLDDFQGRDLPQVLGMIRLEPDANVRTSLVIYLIGRHGLSLTDLDAIRSELSPLPDIAERKFRERRLSLRLDSAPDDQAIVAECIASGYPSLQQKLLARSDLTEQTLATLVTSGANKAIRSLARSRVLKGRLSQQS